MRKRKPVYASLFDLRCDQCGQYLIRSGGDAYLVCPNQCGKLQLEQLEPAPGDGEEPCGLWIEDDLPAN